MAHGGDAVGAEVGALDENRVAAQYFAHKDAVAPQERVGCVGEEAERVGADGHLLGGCSLHRALCRAARCAEQEDKCGDYIEWFHRSAYSAVASKQGQAFAAKSRCPRILASGYFALSRARRERRAAFCCGVRVSLGCLSSPRPPM